MSPRFFRRGREETPNDIPEDMWESCPGCHQLLYTKEIEPLRLCNHCGYHFRLTLEERLAVTADEGSVVEWDTEMEAVDPLAFPEYAEKLAVAQQKTGRKEGIFIGRGAIDGQAVALGIMDLAFFGGSMGYVVGEKVARLFERAASERLPTVVFCASGGARMQESLISLMQMAKTAGAAGKLRDAGVPYISVLLDPTYGGVAASYAFLGDIILAEPGVRLGFAGPRVIEVTRQRIPPGVQTAEFQFAHGMIDAIVPRSQLRATLSFIIRWATA
ncbi:MAG: acetyl-CoA carboxylase carboxyltransferase subunit beta [Candidatus Zipacnadales bacterium]